MIFSKKEEKIPTIRDWLEKAGFDIEGRIILRGKKEGVPIDKPLEYFPTGEVDWDDPVLDRELLVDEFEGVPQPIAQFIAEDDNFKYIPHYIRDEKGYFKVAGIARIPNEELDDYLSYSDQDIPVSF